MASRHTEHYQLNQWEASDQVLRTDFNADNVKIDAALTAKAGVAELEALSGQLAEKASQEELTQLTQRTASLEALPRLVTGTYTGDGAESRLISLGFTPKALLVMREEGYPAVPYTDDFYGGLALPDHPVCLHSPYGDYPVLSIESNGFRVYYDYDQGIFSNQENVVYHYLAWK